MNKIKCLSCGVILESKFRHDYKECGCENSSIVDGGNDYRRIGGVDLTLIEFWDEKKEEWVNVCKQAHKNAE